MKFMAMQNCPKKFYFMILILILQIISDCTAPFQVQFISNSYAAETTPSANNVLPQRGFCFEYQQVGCT